MTSHSNDSSIVNALALQSCQLTDPEHIDTILKALEAMGFDPTAPNFSTQSSRYSDSTFSFLQHLAQTPEASEPFLRQLYTKYSTASLSTDVVSSSKSTIKRKGRKNTSDALSRTPLYIASAHGNSAALNVLADLGADLFAPTYPGSYPMLFPANSATVYLTVMAQRHLSPKDLNTLHKITHHILKAPPEHQPLAIYQLLYTLHSIESTIKVPTGTPTIASMLEQLTDHISKSPQLLHWRPYFTSDQFISSTINRQLPIDVPRTQFASIGIGTLLFSYMLEQYTQAPNATLLSHLGIDAFLATSPNSNPPQDLLLPDRQSTMQRIIEQQAAKAKKSHLVPPKNDPKLTAAVHTNVLALLSPNYLQSPPTDKNYRKTYLHNISVIGTHLMPLVPALLKEPIETVDFSQDTIRISVNDTISNLNVQNVFETLTIGYLHQQPLACTLLPAVLQALQEPSFDPKRKQHIQAQILVGVQKAIYTIAPISLKHPLIQKAPVDLDLEDIASPGQVDPTVVCTQLVQLSKLPSLSAQRLLDVVHQSFTDPNSATAKQVEDPHLNHSQSVHFLHQLHQSLSKMPLTSEQLKQERSRVALTHAHLLQALLKPQTKHRTDYPSTVFSTYLGLGHLRNLSTVQPFILDCAHKTCELLQALPDAQLKQSLSDAYPQFEHAPQTPGFEKDVQSIQAQVQGYLMQYELKPLSKKMKAPVRKTL